MVRGSGIAKTAAVGAATLLITLALSACVDEELPLEPANSTQPNYSGGDGSDEEELFLAVFDGSAAYADSDAYVSLTPYDYATETRLPIWFEESVYLDPDDVKGVPGGYLYPNGGACAYLDKTGTRGSELHPPGSGQSPTGSEEHCIWPGRYTLTFEINGTDEKEFTLDWPHLEETAGGSSLNVWNSTASVNEAVERTEYDPDKNGAWTDFYVYYHRNSTGSYSDTAVLDVENAETTPAQTTFSNETSPSGNDIDWFRYSAYRSTSTWTTPGSSTNGRALVRLYWDTEAGNKSGFYYPWHAGLIRLHRYVDEISTSPDTVSAGLEVMRPDESPGTSQTTRSIVIDELAPKACFTMESDEVTKYADQFFSAGCSTQGANIRYSWRMYTGGSYTTASTDTLLEHSGYTGSGDKTVTLKVEDTSTQLVAYADTTIDVSSTTISLSGETFVTDKTLKTYVATQTGDFYTRTDPDTNLIWSLALSNQDTMTRIWPAGWYDVAMRTHKVFRGEYRRRRLDIEVCYQCPQQQIVSTASWSVVPGVGTDWGVYGAGPWISAGTEASPELVRFYDLTGLHEPSSPFADTGWMSDASGSAEDESGRWNVSWSNLSVLDANTRAYEFQVSPLSGGAYEFGLAIDPDLGDPTDDYSGYDSNTGMVYVADGSRALGFLLLDSNGGNALAKADQFGAKNFAPSARSDAWNAQRGPNVKLREGTDDVQLIVSTMETSGRQSWTLWMLRGDNAQDLSRLARQVIGRR